MSHWGMNSILAAVMIGLAASKPVGAQAAWTFAIDNSHPTVAAGSAGEITFSGSIADTDPSQTLQIINFQASSVAPFQFQFAPELASFFTSGATLTPGDSYEGPLFNILYPSLPPQQTGDFLFRVISANGSPTSLDGLYGITFAAVPESSTFASFGLGLLFMFGYCGFVMTARKQKMV